MSSENAVPIITIDGPSGTGKGTLCIMLAKKLGWNILDSGSIYRLLALSAIQSNTDLDDIQSLTELANQLDFHFVVDPQDNLQVFLNNNNVSQAIRDESCGQVASTIASQPEIRQALLERQRAFAKGPGLVTDGRDMGTVVFPSAVLKIYLDASTEERAKRRYLQLQETQNNATLASVVEELRIRDERDATRKHAPLKPAKDAILVDTTSLNIMQVCEYVLQLITERLRF